MLRSLVFLLILCSSTAHSVENLSFNQLADLNPYDPEIVRAALVDYIDQEVLIRGFVYQNGDGRFVLSSRPSIATCCQKKQENLPHQIYLEGDLVSSSSGAAVPVQGIFSLAPVRDRSGKLIELYALREARVSPVANHSTWVFLGLAFGLTLLFLRLYKKRKC